MTLPVAAFASGGGTNLQALLDNETPHGPYRIEMVLSDRPGAGALERATRSGRQAWVVPVKGRDPGEVQEETLRHLEGAGIQAIFLAGYLRLVPGAVVRRFRRRILNIHPALLPAFGGKGMWGHHVHEAVLASGARISGPTVHYVDEEYDTGTIIAQWPVPVRAGDDAAALAARVLKVEHALYPAAADHVCAAISSGRHPGPFSPPADVYTPAHDVTPDELRRRIDASFQPS
jgi:formyltetrahydrofolate-dependent phosphoribosylglycinamide formyltransferase